jgi:cytidylate kinase
MSLLQIAIDGPAGSGKSTVAKAIANRLGITYLDTGAMYRAITWFALEQNFDVHCSESLKEAVLQMALSISPTQIFVGGTDVTEAIRSPLVTQNVSFVSMDGFVREKMVALQRHIASDQPVIMDGRDIGTVVLPNARYKFFLVADPAERAKRRMLELKEKGFQTSLEDLTEEIIRRDLLDSKRDVSPLAKADDAIEIDTTHQTIEDVVEKILSYITAE